VLPDKSLLTEFGGAAYAIPTIAASAGIKTIENLLGIFFPSQDRSRIATQLVG
jgi:hypothetical protein